MDPVGNILGKRKLTRTEVNKLHKLEPKLELPYYPKEVVGVGPNEVSHLKINVKGKNYFVKASPYVEDEWFEL